MFVYAQYSSYNIDYITAWYKKKNFHHAQSSCYIYVFFSFDYSNLFFFFILSLLISSLGDALLYMFGAIAFRNNHHHMTMYVNVGVSYEASRFFFSFFLCHREKSNIDDRKWEKEREKEKSTAGTIKTANNTVYFICVSFLFLPSLII
jgi:hypothetical protein